MKYLVPVLGAGTNARITSHETLLHAAVNGGHLPVVEYLVSTVGVNVNMRNEFDKTGLYLSLKGDRKEAAYAIEESGPSVEGGMQPSPACSGSMELPSREVKHTIKLANFFR